MIRRLSLLVMLTLLLSACRVIPEETPPPLPPIEIPTVVLLSPTPLPSPTPEPTLTPTPQPTIEVQAVPKMPPFVPLDQAPVFAPAFTHAQEGCNWMGLAGQAFDSEGRPIVGLVVVVEGNVAGTPVEALGFSGLATAYGPGGFEVKLSDQVMPGIFWVQLFDIDAQPLIEPLNFTMLSGCERNLAVLNFRQLDASFQVSLPVQGQ